MRRYMKFFFAGLIIVASLGVSVLLIYNSQDLFSQNNSDSNQPAMTEAHPQFSQIMEEMRQLDPDEIDEIYEQFKDNAQRETKHGR